jgi:hypothetical protein
MNSVEIETTRTLRVRLKDKHAAFLRAQSREVNFVWNYVNELGLKMLQREWRFCTAYDLHRYSWCDERRLVAAFPDRTGGQ